MTKARAARTARTAFALLTCLVGCKGCPSSSSGTAQGTADSGGSVNVRVDASMASANDVKTGDGSASASASASANANANPTHGTSRADLEAAFAAHPELTTLDDVPGFLPRTLAKSFVLKHGRNRVGERGHLVEKRISQSADPQAPRAILWDERSGLVMSYNGGLPSQKNGQRLDIHFFDDKKNVLSLESVDFPLSAPGHPVFRTTTAGADCATCHGPRMRPIFSMYPDWPGFYGSDNDELSNVHVPVQVAELADYQQFRRDVASKHPRYAPLFLEANVEETMGRKLYDTFPYRPDVSEDIHAVSRAFAFRPGLRLGILLNRMQARALVEHVRHHARYAQLGRAFLSNLLACSSKLSTKIRGWIEAAIGEPLKLVKSRARDSDGGSGDGGDGGGIGDVSARSLFHYRQMWKIFDLDVRDVDIRYSYSNEGYRSDDASANPMAVGYIGGAYWNSYFDGSATIDELVAYGLYEDQARIATELAGRVTPNGLGKKYEHLKDRFRLDAKFFSNMDEKGLWIPIPYPRELNDVHHREGFPAAYRKQHDALCAALAEPDKGL